MLGAPPPRNPKLPAAPDPPVKVNGTMPPPPSNQVANLPSTNNPVATPMAKSQLVALMKQATVLVLAADGSGSGFFIAPNLVITNHHVVAGAANGEVAIVGEGLDHPRTGRIIATTGDRGMLAPDFALVKVNDFNSNTTLSFTTQSQALQSVIATGYPALLLDADQNFHNLMQGDLTAMPALVFSEGSVMAVQSGAGGIQVLAHSADISGGNSGGPLVDQCGRVVGINTLVAVDQEQSRNAGYALASTDLTAWLQSNGVTATVHGDPCQP